MESKDIAHGPLEFVYTIDEETGLTGAASYPAGLLGVEILPEPGQRGDRDALHRLFGRDQAYRSPKESRWAGRRQRDRRGALAGRPGFKGGHSGVDIHQGRGNALRILGGVLQGLLKQRPQGRVRGGRDRGGTPRTPSARGGGRRGARRGSGTGIEDADRQRVMRSGRPDSADWMPSWGSR